MTFARLHALDVMGMLVPSMPAQARYPLVLSRAGGTQQAYLSRGPV